METSNDVGNAILMQDAVFDATSRVSLKLYLSNQLTKTVGFGK